MSILKKLKKIEKSKQSGLYERHPLSDESFEDRLCYLACVALLTAIDREPSAVEKSAFLALASSLGVDESDASEQLSERNSIAEEDIGKLLGDIVRKKQQFVYMVDVAWMHSVDGEHDENELSALESLGEILGEEVQELSSYVHDFVRAAINKDDDSAVESYNVLRENENIKPLLAFIINKGLNEEYIDARIEFKQLDDEIESAKEATAAARVSMKESSKDLYKMLLSNCDNFYVGDEIPRRKVMNAIESYANYVSRQDVLVLFDDTAFGSASDGFLMTSDAIYAKELFSDGVEINIEDIRDIGSDGKKLFVNEEKFVGLALWKEDDLDTLVSYIKCYIDS